MLFVILKEATSVTNCIPILILNLSKVFQFIIYGHVFYYFYFRLDFCQHAFTKSKNVVGNLILYFDFIYLSVSSQLQVYEIYFNVNSSFSLFLHAFVPHTLLVVSYKPVT